MDDLLGSKTAITDPKTSTESSSFTANFNGMTLSFSRGGITRAHRLEDNLNQIVADNKEQLENEVLDVVLSRTSNSPKVDLSRNPTLDQVQVMLPHDFEARFSLNKDFQVVLNDNFRNQMAVVSKESIITAPDGSIAIKPGTTLEVAYGCIIDNQGLVIRFKKCPAVTLESIPVLAA